MMGTLSLETNVESNNTIIINKSHTKFYGITIENTLFGKVT